MDITNIFEAMAALLAVLITAVIIPWVKSKTTATQQANIDAWVKIAVQAAEQIYNGPAKGPEKKAYVLDFLQKNGITLDATALDALVEAAVLALNNGILQN